MFELGAAVSNIVLQAIGTRQMNVEIGGGFIQMFYIYVKDSFNEES